MRIGGLKPQGYIMLPVMITVVLVATIAFMMHHEGSMGSRTISNELEADSARYLAEGGINHAQWQVIQAGCGPYSDITNQSFSNGSYSATITPNMVTGSSNVYVNLPVDQDAWLNESVPLDNYGADVELSVKNVSGDDKQALYRFDLSAIPIGSQVASATASFYVSSNDPDGAITVHRVTADWTEGTADWNSMATQYDVVQVATIPTQVNSGVTVQINITSQVQAWVNGAEPNYGIMLIARATGNETKLASREWSTASQRPRLDVVTSTGALPTRADINVTGTLANGVTRSVTREDLILYQATPSALELQPGDASGKDAEIWEQAPNNNYGGAAETWVSSASNDTTRSLLQFDMGAIPIGARILEATLSLQRQSGSGADQPVSAHRIMNPWSENSVTWNSRKTGTNWDTAGVDFDDIAVATTPVGPANQRYDWNIMPLVQGWVDGIYPNYGIVLVAAIAGMPGERFYTSDDIDPVKHPRLDITYICECGQACIAPTGSGRIAMVGNWIGLSPNPLDLTREEILESWGYEVDIFDDNLLWLLDSSNYDVIYISATASDSALVDQLKYEPIGIVYELEPQNNDLGMASTDASTVGTDIEITNNVHYITLPFPAGALTIKTAASRLSTISGTAAAGAQVLAETGGLGSLLTLDNGAALGGTGVGEFATDRRVMLPIGMSSTDDWRHLTSNGRLIVQRAIQWATGNTVGFTVGEVLFAVGDATNLTTEDTAKKALIESWNYTLVPISDEASQADIDAALASADVVYITESVTSGTVGSKFTGTTIGVLNEEGDLNDELGMSSDSITYWTTDLTITDNSHYITETFTTGTLSIVDSSQRMNALAATMAPGLQNLAISGSNSSLDILESGAALWGGGSAAGRRAKLPWATGTQFDVNALNADGRTLLQRAIEWGAGAGSDSLTLPIAHWKLDETSGTTAVDSEGGHDGGLIGGRWISGAIDGGLEFNGTSDHISVADDDALDLVDSFTFSAWINNNEYNLYDLVLNKGDSGTDWNYYFGTYDNEITFGFYLGGYIEFQSSSVDLQPDTWYHIAVTFENSTDLVKLYLDGVEVYSGSTPLDPPINAGKLYIGRSQNGAYWNGELDDVRIYDSVLAATEIADLHAAGSGEGGGNPILGDCDGTYRDEFNAQNYTGNDGILLWSTAWEEAGESTDPTGGDIFIDNDVSNYQLKLQDDGQSVMREADLDGAASATLSFDYRRENLKGTSDYVAVEVSYNGGMDWAELARFTGSADDSTYTSTSYPLDAGALSATTRIQFLTPGSGMNNTNAVWFDNIQIQCSP